MNEEYVFTYLKQKEKRNILMKRDIYNDIYIYVAIYIKQYIGVHNDVQFVK